MNVYEAFELEVKINYIYIKYGNKQNKRHERTQKYKYYSD